MLTQVKEAVLPSGLTEARIPLGLAAGVRMRLDLARSLRLYLGMYELEVARHIRALCAPGVTSFDVGAEHGYDALIFAKLSGASVHSFDCDPAAIARMHDSFALNPELARRITPVEAFVGSRPDELALDDHVAATGVVPGFVKIDVEGAESRVLDGAAGLVAEHRPSLLVEVHSIDEEAACMRRLEGHRYRVVVVSQRKVLPDHRPIPHNRWLVCVP